MSSGHAGDARYERSVTDADGHIAIRDYLSLTISFDHETIDGALAARFTERLKELIESGYGLDDSTVESEQAITPETSRKS
jgi:pyruvate/2-oxoglutarate dehydrogenase complex dihydrolipoamide acyltransferase (E2) component